MLTIKVKDNKLEKQLTELLHEKFRGDTDKMMQTLIESYASQLERLNYSGILTWNKDGLAYQQEIRSEWE